MQSNFPEYKLVEKAIDDCLLKLFEQDFILITNDVSERAITHKIAEYLQISFPDRNVDCEYNRNVELGPNGKKILQIGSLPCQNSAEKLPQLDSSAEYITYPDIVIHNRGDNANNLLVV